MPIFFRNTPLQEPFTLDSAGFDWHQEPWDRPDGYPLYHYLQTEQAVAHLLPAAGHSCLQRVMDF